MSKKTELSEKQWEALALLQKGVPRKEVAVAIKVSLDYLNKLCSGNVTKCGKVATLFKAEYLKVQKKNAEETKLLVAGNMKKAQELIGSVFDELGKKKKLSQEDQKMVSMYTNALARCQPSDSAKNVSFSYVKGLSAEELIHEFKRLKTIAESSFETRKRVEIE